jgi:hypothetical protein
MKITAEQGYVEFKFSTGSVLRISRKDFVHYRYTGDKIFFKGVSIYDQSEITEITDNVLSNTYNSFNSLDDIDVAIRSVKYGQSAPEIRVLGISVDDTNSKEFIVLLDQNCTSTIAGWLPKINAAGATVVGITGSGTNILKIQIAEKVVSTDALTLDYDSVSGDATNTISPSVDLASVTAFVVTNNVLPVAQITVLSDVTTVGYGNKARTSWRVDSSIPLSFTIERSVSGGPWTQIEASYQMPNPFTGYKMTNNRNFYYIDEGLTKGNNYQYRVAGYTGNLVTLIGNTYYVKTGGSDSADGLTTGTAWATSSKAASNRNPGDLVLFNKGDTFNNASTLYAHNVGDGTLTNPIAWSSYGSGNQPVLSISAGSSYNLSFRDNSNWMFHDLDIRGGSRINLYFEAENKDISGIKVFNCKLDGAAHTGSFMACVHITEDNASVNKTSNYACTDVEIAYCDIRNAGNGTSNADGIRGFAVTSDMHVHNNYFINNGGGGGSGEACDIAGGLNHTIEYNEMVGGTYAAHKGNGTKNHGQQHYVENAIFRGNLIYYMDGFGISLQDSKNGIIEYNTLYANADGNNCLTFSSKNNPERFEGNIVRNNIGYGSIANDKNWKAVVGIKLSDLMESNYSGPSPDYHLGAKGSVEPRSLEWYQKITFSNNCFKEVTNGAIVQFTNTIGSNSNIDTNGEFVTDWNGTYGYATDINEDPSFTNASTADFSTGNANVVDMGCFAGSQAEIEFSPLDYSPLMMYDGDVSGSIVEGDSGRVSQWTDQSGNGYNLVQESGSQPVLGANFVNIADTGWLDNVTLSLAENYPIQVFVRCKYNGAPTNVDWLFGFRSSGHPVVSRGWGIRLENGDVGMDAHSGDGTNYENHSIDDNRSWNTIVTQYFEHNATDSKINGTDVGETSSPRKRTNVNGFILGNGATYSEYKCDVSFYQLIVYDKILSDEERNNVLNWLNNR